MYYDGEPLCSCLPGKKQWAVVNTKLCVFPDQFMIDLVNHKVEFMETKISNGGTAVWTNKSLSISRGPIIYAKTTGNFQITDGSSFFVWQLTADAVSWTEQGGWSFTNLSATTLGNNQGTHIIFPEKVTFNSQSGTYTLSYPEIRVSSSNPGSSVFTTTDLENNPGFYGVAKFIRERTSDFAEYEINWYWLQQENPVLSEVFTVGEQISITDTYGGLLDVPYADILSIDDSTNTITFVGSTPLGVGGKGLMPKFVAELKNYYEPQYNYYYFRLRNGSSTSYWRFQKRVHLSQVHISLLQTHRQAKVISIILKQDRTKPLQSQVRASLLTIDMAGSLQWLIMTRRYLSQEHSLNSIISVSMTTDCGVYPIQTKLSMHHHLVILVICMAHLEWRMAHTQ